jgi:putative ABC transport system permease protein
VLLALRNLTHDRTRFALSVAGVSLAVMLILLLGAYRAGIYRQTSAYLDRASGSVIVAQRGVRDFLATNSILPEGAAEAVARVPGVARVVSVVAQTTIVEMDGSKQLAFFIGYETGAGGGPWDLVDGREPTGDNEVVVDRVMAAEHGIGVGDRVTVLGRTLNVVGLANGTALWIGSFVFADTSTIQSLMRAPLASSFLFVTPQEGISPEQLRDRLNVPGTDAMLKSDVIAADQHLFAKVYDAAIGLMTAIAFFVGVLVVGLIVYTATIERRREYGAFKAIGARNRTLYKVVTIQALVAGVTGAAAGTLLAYGVGRLLVVWRPQFPVAIEPSAILVALAASVAMAVLAALMPARAIARLAPAEVFR